MDALGGMGRNLRRTFAPPPPALALPGNSLPCRPPAAIPPPGAARHPRHRLLLQRRRAGPLRVPERSDRASRFVAIDRLPLSACHSLPHLPRQPNLGQPPIAENSIGGNFQHLGGF